MHGAALGVDLIFAYVKNYEELLAKTWVSGLLNGRNYNQYVFIYIYICICIYVYVYVYMGIHILRVSVYKKRYFPTFISPPSKWFSPARHYDLCCATLVLTNVTWHNMTLKKKHHMFPTRISHQGSRYST